MGFFLFRPLVCLFVFVVYLFVVYLLFVVVVCLFVFD